MSSHIPGFCMLFGRTVWIVIWCGILLLGVVGLFASLYWGRQTHYRNLDEIVRACGTILVSTGFIFLLLSFWTLFAEGLLVVALGCFVAAFILGRRAAESQPPPE